MADFNATRQIVSFGKLCSWRTGTAVATGIMAYSGKETIQGTWEDAVCLLKQQEKTPSSLEP